MVSSEVKREWARWIQERLGCRREAPAGEVLGGLRPVPRVQSTRQRRTRGCLSGSPLHTIWAEEHLRARGLSPLTGEADDTPPETAVFPPERKGV